MIRSENRFRYALIVAAVLVFALAFQGTRGLWEPDEGRYSAIAAQMLRSGDFVVPAFNDETTHFAKPPLTYWAVAGGMSLLGWNEWGARLANALAFAATVLVLHALAKRVTPGRPWLPPLVYASFPLAYLGGNMLTPDTLLALWEALGVLGFVLWRERRATPRAGAALVLMWAAFALAFLTKGPPGLLPLAVILVFVAKTEGLRGVRALASVAGIAAFAALGLGWYALVAATHPGLITYFLRDEVWARMTSSSVQRNPAWYGPFVVYVPTLLLGTLPWTGPLLRATRSLPRLATRSWWSAKLRDDPWTAFLALWVLVPLAVMCLSRSRLPLYLLPICAPLALVLGRILPERPLFRVRIGALASWFAVLLAARAAGALYPYPHDSLPMARSIAADASPNPGEIVFVDSKPVWGVGVYLKCEVESVSLAEASPPGQPPALTLEAEMAENEPGTVLVVPERSEAGTIALLDRIGRPAREVGRVGSLRLLEPELQHAPRVPER